MEDDKKDNQETQNAAKEPGVRILARAGEAFDAGGDGPGRREGGLTDPSRLEPTDQSFVFAAPGERHAAFVDDDERLHAAEVPAQPRPLPHEPAGAAQPALDLTGSPDLDIPWRVRPLLPGAAPPPVGVLLGGAAPEERRGVYDTEPGLFGPGASGAGAGGEPGGERCELVLGVKFREYGSVYFFRAGGNGIKAGSRVLVETGQGIGMAEVISARRMRLPLPKIRTPEGEDLEIAPILGLPGPGDVAADAENRILASGARLFCKECIRERGLDMKLVDVEVLHDRGKIIFYFTAPTRIDFRDLVKDLVRNYRTRIELRQIGVRHETQMLGALGNCGMTCCCRRYLRHFAPVTIKMAKEQNLFLNPAKLSGICGRLLCCLANEQKNYEDFHGNCPKIGKKYQTTRGVMKVGRASLFRQSIMAVGENGEEEEFQLDGWYALEPKRLDARDARGPGQERTAAERTLDGPNEDAADEADLGAGFSPFGAEADLAGLADLEDEARGAPEASAPGAGGRERPRRNGRQAGDKRAGQGSRPGDGQGADADRSIFGLPGSRYRK